LTHRNEIWQSYVAVHNKGADVYQARPRTVTALAAALQGVGGGLGWSLLPPLMPSIAGELKLSHVASGVVWGMAPLGIAVASPLGGAFVDKYGPRRVATWAMLAGALACAARALAFDAVTLGVAMFAFGVHIGFVAPSIPKALSGHVDTHKLARAYGLALLAYTLGTALTVLTARTVIAPLLGGWRPTMVAAGAAMALTGLLWGWKVTDRTTLSRHASLRAVFALAANADLRRTALMHFCLFGGYLALLGTLPRSLMEAGLTAPQMGLAVAGWLVAAAAGNAVGPILSDRLGQRRPFILAGAALAAVSLGLLALHPTGPALVLLGVAALGGGCFAPLLLTLPLELSGVGPQKAGAAIGLLMLVGQAGGFLLPILTGAASQQLGFTGALVFLSFVHGLILVPGLRFTESGSKRASGVENLSSIQSA
jgi:MFS family permease